MTNLPTILIDSREKKPYKFETASEVVTLMTGDYALKGYESLVCVERKTMHDFVATVTRGRARWERELQRMQGFKRKWVLIEGKIGILDCDKSFDRWLASYSERWAEFPKRVRRSHIIGAVDSCEIRWGVPIKFCENRTRAQAWCERQLLYAHKRALMYQNKKGG